MLSLSQQYVPEEWCIHCITPIHKLGDKSSVKGYRPISLLCKVLERVLYNAVSEFVVQSIVKYLVAGYGVSILFHKHQVIVI